MIKTLRLGICHIIIPPESTIKLAKHPHLCLEWIRYNNKARRHLFSKVIRLPKKSLIIYFHEIRVKEGKEIE